MQWPGRYWALVAACLITACGGGGSNSRAPTPQPTVTSVSASAALPNAQISVAGTLLTQVTSVHCGGAAAVFSVESDTQLTFKVPVGATTGELIIAGSGFSISQAFTVLGEPLIQTVQASTTSTGVYFAPVGHTITVNGANLDQAAGYAAGATALSVVSSTASTATLQMPAQAASGTLTINDKAGNALLTSFQVAAYVPMTVTGIGPTSGTIGAPITVSGTGLDAVDRVAFSTGAAPDSAAITAQSPSSLTVTVPPTASNGAVTVESPYQSIASRVAFTLVPRIWVSDITPALGPGSEQTLTISGANLDQVSSLSIGGVAATLVNAGTASQIVATAPATASGTVLLGSSSQADVTAGAIAISSSGGLYLVGADVAQVLDYSAANPHLRLTPGRPAVLRTYLVSSTPGSPAPEVLVNILQNGKVVWTPATAGPGSLSGAYSRTDLTTSFNTWISGAFVQPGFSLQITAGPLSMNVAPAVGAPTKLNLVLVPLTVGVASGTLPATSDVVNALSMLFPYPQASIQVTTRANAVATGLTTITGAADLATALQALESARRLDGATSSFYYGFVPVASISAGTTTGVANINPPFDAADWQLSAVGVDDPGAYAFVSPFTTLSATNWEFNLVHGLGHAHSLYDAPCGTATNPDPNFPYVGASLGSMPAYASYYNDNTVGSIGDPTGMTDVMGYCQGLWFSDYNYLYVQQFAEAYSAANTAAAAAARALPAAIAPALAQAASPRGYVTWSGTITNDSGRIYPAIASGVALTSSAPRRSDYVLRVTTDRKEVIDLPLRPLALAGAGAGVSSFFVGMPNPGNVASVELLHSGTALPLLNAGGRAALRAGSGGPAIRSLHYSIGTRRLHLDWDATAEPYLDVVYADAGGERRSLAHALGGGSADIDLQQLGDGGQFEIGLSTGAGARLVRIDRRGNPVH